MVHYIHITLHMFVNCLFDREFTDCLLHVQVLEVEQSDVKVSVTFIRDWGSYFTHPAVADESLVDTKQIIQLMDHPTVTGSHQYRLLNDEMSSINLSVVANLFVCFYLFARRIKGESVQVYFLLNYLLD